MLLRREIEIENSAMKTVLKDAKTGLLLRNMDEWTSNIAEAAGFRDTLAALKFCQRHNLSGVAIVHIFNGGKGQRVAGFYHRGTSLPQVKAIENPQVQPNSEETVN